MIQTAPPPPPLPSKLQGMIMEDPLMASPSTISVSSSRKSKKSSSSSKLSSMLPRRLSEGSMKKKKDKKRKSKSPKPISRSKSHNETWDVSSLSSSSNSFMPKRLSDKSLKKKRGEKKRSKSPKPNDPFLPKRLSDSSLKRKKDEKKRRSSSKSPKPNGDPLLLLRRSTEKSKSKKKTKSLNDFLDMSVSSRSSGSISSSKRISRNNASFSGEFKKISRNDSNNSLSSRSSRNSRSSRGSIRSHDNLRLPARTKSMSRAKKAAESKAIMDSLVSSLLTHEVSNFTNTVKPTTVTINEQRKVRFDKEVLCKPIDNSTFDPDAIWFSNMEIMEHRKREQTSVNRDVQDDLDVEGMFTLEERNIRSSRMMQAFEAVFDMQMIHKKEKELEAAVGIFRGGLYMEALDGDHEDAMASEYMKVAAPALESAVMRATHLQVHVQLLWGDN